MSDSNQSGFTIVELLVAITAGTVVSLAVLTISIFFVSDIFKANEEAKMSLEAQNVLRLVTNDLRVGSKVLETNSILDAHQPPGGWVTSNSNVVIIISKPATDNNFEFILDEDEGELFQDEIIYYKDSNGSLRKRILAANTTSNVAVTSCPDSLATTSCPADRVLSDAFQQMNFIFYDVDGVETTTIVDARSIKITIDLQKDVYGNSVEVTNINRVTMRNPS